MRNLTIWRRNAACSVRPTRWMYSASSPGQSYWTTQSTAGKSEWGGGGAQEGMDREKRRIEGIR